MVLKINEKYDKARRQFETYLVSDPQNSYVQSLIESCQFSKGKRTGQYRLRNLVSVNTPAADFCPVIQNGALVFSSDRRVNMVDNYTYGWTGRYFLDLFRAERNSDTVFVQIQSISNELNSPYHDAASSFSADGKEIYFSRSGKSKNRSLNGQIYANRPKIFSAMKVNGKWKNIVSFAYNSEDYSTDHPSISRDGRRLYFASDMPGGFGGADIYYCDRAGDGWGKPVNLGPAVNTRGNEKFPYIHPNGKLYFSSDGHVGYGGLDLYMVMEGQGKVSVENLGRPFNSSWDDFGMYSENDSTGYLSSNRSGGYGNDDIYYFEPDRSVKNDSMIAVEDTQKTLTNVWDDSTKSIPMSEKEPRNSSKQTMAEDNDRLPPIASQVENQQASENEPSDPESRNTRRKNMMEVYLKDAMSGDLINVADAFLLNEQGVPLERLEGKDGKFRFKIKGKGTYYIKVFSPKYNTQCFRMNLADEEDDQLNVFRLSPLPANEFTYVDIINYDFDKSDIRKDAARKLDKLFEVYTQHQSGKIILSSHTDRRGSFQYNEALSKRRAQSARMYLSKKGIYAESIAMEWHGKKKLKSDCDLRDDEGGASGQTVIPSADTSSYYRIQLFARSKNIPLPDSLISRIPGEKGTYIDTLVSIDPPRKLYRYTAGYFASDTLAQRMKTIFRDSGFPGAFPVKFRGAQRVDVNPLARIENPVNDQCPEYIHQENRRTEIKIQFSNLSSENIEKVYKENIRNTEVNMKQGIPVLCGND
jgi:outer membrane protein OmpA-like peptidoglycan-associated protein